MRWHADRESRGDKTIIFSDNIFALEHYARKLDRPFIAGYVTHNERQKLLVDFKNLKASLGRSSSRRLATPRSICRRRALSFRSPRILARAVRRRSDWSYPSPKTQREKGGANAYFYTLISKDTQEMYYSGKRQQFLVDQGYAFRVILPEEVLRRRSRGREGASKLQHKEGAA